MTFAEAFKIAVNENLLLKRSEEYGFISVEYRPVTFPYIWLADAETNTLIDEDEFDYLSQLSDWEVCRDYLNE